MNIQESKSNSVSYTKEHEDRAKAWLGDLFSQYLEQINKDIRDQELFLNHCEDIQNIDIIANTKRRLRGSEKEKQEVCFVIDFLTQKGAL